MYLEALDDEYWAVLGQPAPSPAPLRDAYVAARRSVMEAAGADREAQDTAQSALDDAENAFRHEVFSRLHGARRSALCFSGGGIRSATFGLGILQGLAAHSSCEDGQRPKLLGEFDYLSTVSGGGYLGSWFSAWWAREAAGTWARRRRRGRHPEAVEESRYGIRSGTGGGPASARLQQLPDPAARPASPATPGRSIGTIVRNMFLNWTVLIPLLAVIRADPVGRVGHARDGASVLAGQWTMLAGGFAFGALATAYIGFDLPSAGNARGDYARYVALLSGAAGALAVLLNTFWAWLPPGRRPTRHGGTSSAWAEATSPVAPGRIRRAHALRRDDDRHAHRDSAIPSTAGTTGLVATAAAIITGAIGGLVMMFIIITRAVPVDGITDVRPLRHRRISTGASCVFPVRGRATRGSDELRHRGQGPGMVGTGGRNAPQRRADLGRALGVVLYSR